MQVAKICCAQLWCLASEGEHECAPRQLCAGRAAKRFGRLDGTFSTALSRDRTRHICRKLAYRHI